MTPTLSLLKSIFEIDYKYPSGLAYKPGPVRYSNIGKGMKKMRKIQKTKQAGILRKHNKTGHLAWRVALFGMDVYVHRIIYMLYNEIQLTESDLIDHKDRNGLNNNPNNIRLANSSENCCNTRVRKDNSLGYTGICLHRGNRYGVQITKNKSKICIGSFINLTDAIQARIEAEKKYHGEFAASMNT